MFYDRWIAMGASRSAVLLGQLVEVEPDPENAERAALVFSGPQFFTALIAGVVLAFAFQLLLTNLGVAAGISLAGGSSDGSADRGNSESLSGTIRKISTVVGLSTLLTVALSLFVACLFAVRLSLFATPFSGAIVGLVIWATYFSLMVWVSSTTVGSFVGSVVNAATSGMQALMGTAAAAIGGKAVSQQAVATAEAAASAVRRELTSGLDPTSFRENVEDYIQALRPSQLDVKAIRAEFEDLLDDPNLRELAKSDRLPDLNRQTFVELVSSRSDLSKREVERLANQLEGAWQKSIDRWRKSDSWEDFANYLRSAAREQLVGRELSDKVDALREEIRQQRDREPQQEEAATSGLAASLSSLSGIVMGRADLSKLDIDKAIAQIEKLKSHVGEQTDKIADRVSSISQSPIRSDIKEYLFNAYPWQLDSQNLEREFRDLLYDREADPAAVADQLAEIQRSDFLNWLRQRDLSPILTLAKIESIANRLEAIRLEVLATAEAARDREEAISLLAEVEAYLLETPKDALTPAQIQNDFKSLLDDPDVDDERLQTRLSQFDRPTFERILEQRKEMSAVEASALITELEMARDRALEEARQRNQTLGERAEQQWLKTLSYLRDTGKEQLNPESIERELKLLVDDPQAGAAALKSRAARFNRDTLVQLLAQRQDTNEEEAEQIIERVENIWLRTRYAPQTLTRKAQEKYDRATTAIAEYLRSTGKEELDPEGIERDLKLLLDDPKAGYHAIKGRLASMDRDTLVQLLGQRDDLSEEQVEQAIDSVQSTLAEIARTPRALARRTQQQAQNFKSALEDYLRSTDREELNPNAIERDLQLLLQDPRLGMESLQERLSQFDRETLVALLSQREDISEADVNRIIDQILAIRDRAVQQFQRVRARVQSAIDRLLAKIRNYLNSLERPELNYDGIQSDLLALFDDPQAGFEGLRDRFSQVDRNTLVALLSSRDDISQTDAEHLVARVERTRDRVLQKAERLQQQT
ncbi:MAG: MFS transporter, partial [Cyanobacteriota bacterium]|nr:MFS transporter [Cyanobacteriota bacterium]